MKLYLPVGKMIVHANAGDVFRWAMTRLSKHFMTIGVRATEQQSFMHDTTRLLGTGMM